MVMQLQLSLIVSLIVQTTLRCIGSLIIIYDYFKFKYNDRKYSFIILDHIAMMEFIDDLVCLIHLLLFDKM